MQVFDFQLVHLFSLLLQVLDEAHHIADKTQNHFSTSARINSTHQWLDNVNNILSSLTQRFARPHNLLALATSVAGETIALQSMFEALSAGLNIMPFETKDEDREIYRFPLGEVPETLMDLSLATLPSMHKLCDDLEGVHDLLQEAVAGNLDWEKAFDKIGQEGTIEALTRLNIPDSNAIII